eukprot:Tbor_TRINITY_DN5124_c0_g1::TRINITY_DN5124_c0_g1_i2::g.26036::m.26036
MGLVPMKASGQIAKIIEKTKKSKTPLIKVLSSRFEKLPADEMTSLKERAKNLRQKAELDSNVKHPFKNELPTNLLNKSLNNIDKASHRLSKDTTKNHRAKSAHSTSSGTQIRISKGDNVFKYKIGMTPYETYLMEMKVSRRINKIIASNSKKGKPLDVALYSSFKSLSPYQMKCLEDRASYNPRTALPVPECAIKSAIIKRIPINAVKANWYSSIHKGATVNKRLNRIAELIGMRADNCSAGIPNKRKSRHTIYLAPKSLRIERMMKKSKASGANVSKNMPKVNNSPLKRKYKIKSLRKKISSKAKTNKNKTL